MNKRQDHESGWSYKVLCILGRPLLRPAKVSITSKECDTSNEVNNAIIMMEFNVHSTTNNEITIVMVYLWRQFLDK